MQDVGTPNGTLDCRQDPICGIKGLHEAPNQEFCFERLISGNGHVSLRELQRASGYTNSANREVIMRDGHLNTFYAFTSPSAFIPACHKWRK